MYSLAPTRQGFFHGLHGHQSKTLAMFVFGAIKAESIVLSRVAEALLAESDAKAPSIERRLERFLSNTKIETEKTWETLLQVVMPFFRGKPLRLMIDLTPFGNIGQASTNGAWTNPWQIFLNSYSLQGILTAGNDATGDLRAFASGSDNSILQRTYTYSGGGNTWTAMISGYRAGA